MVKKFSGSIIVLLLLVLMAQLCLAQTHPKTSPYKVGETLNYDIKATKILPVGTIGAVTFTVTNASEGNNYMVKTAFTLKGTLVKLLGKKVLQNIDSTVNGESLSVLKTAKHDVQGERIRDSVAVFDYKTKTVTFVETDPNDPARPPRKIASAIGDETFDIISGIYFLRSLPLAVGRTYELAISDTGLVYKIPVRVTAREQQKSAIGKVWCFRLEPDLFGPGKFLENKGNMSIWITDDARHLPVRSVVNYNGYKLEIKLKKTDAVQ